MKSNTLENPGWKRNVNTYLLGNKALVIVIMLGVILSFSTDKFFTQTNILNVLRQVCVSTIVATGFTMLLGANDIDLSVGSILGLSGMVAGMLMVNLKMDTVPAMLLTVCLGMACGVLNACMIIVLDLPPFIVTMGTSQIFRGACYLVTSMRPIIRLPQEFVQIGQGFWLGIPIPIFIMLGVLLIVYVICNFTMFGRHAIAMGGNKDAARVSGINTVAVRIGVYALVGACAAIASFVMTARTASSQPAAGVGMEMDAIAAVVIGGTSMSGGSAHVISTLFGCILVGMMDNGLNLLGVNSNWQVVMKGLLILFAISLDKISSRIYAARA